MSEPICMWCDEPVLPGEQQREMMQPIHVECAFRSITGSVGHLLRRCSCCSKFNLGDPPHLTKREAATAALALWRQITGWYGIDSLL